MMAVWRGLSATVRGVGATLDAIGASMQGHLAPREGLMPPINRLTFQGQSPSYPQHSFVAPNAAVIGNVTLGARSSVWYGATLRGDVNAIKVGHTTNIQDRVVVHVAKHNAEGQSRETVIGDKCTIGHGAIVHACTIEDEVLIGMGAKVLDGAVVRRGSIVAAGALVAPHTEIPAGQVWAGCPAKFLRELEPAEEAFLSHSAENYAKLAAEHWYENTKTYLRHLYDDMIHEDIKMRDPNMDEELGLHRDPYTRELGPGDEFAEPPSSRTALGPQDGPRALEKSG